MRARVLPALLALVIVAVVGTDVAVAADLRAEARAKAAAAAEKRAFATYRAQLRPLAETIYDQVQPLMEAAEGVSYPGPDTSQIMADVFGHTGTAARLRALRPRLAAIPAPGRVRTTSRSVLTAFDLLIAAAEDAERKALDNKSEEVDLALAGTGITSVVLQWTSPVVAAFGDLKPPAVPGGFSTRPRAPQSRGAYVLAADQLCSTSIDRGLALPPMDTARQVAAAAPRYAKYVRSVLSGLRAIEVPATEKARVERDIRSLFTGTSKVADGMEQVSTAVRTQSPATARRGLDNLIAGLRASQKLSHGLAGYGATVCSVVFAVDDRDIAELTGKPAEVGTPA